MLSYITRRVIFNIIVFFIVSVFLYIFINMMPGDPLTAFIPPHVLAQAGEDFIQQQREALGLHQPLYIRYFYWFRNFLQGDLGVSIHTGEPVLTRIMGRIGPTMILTGLSLTISILIGIIFGIISAIKKNSFVDYLLTGISFMAVSVPNFFAGLILIYFFSIQLGLLPTGGIRPIGREYTLFDSFKHLILPVSALGLYSSAQFLRYVRASVLETLDKDYVRTARAKGLNEKVVQIKHVFRNSLNTLITVIAIHLPILFGGAVVTEQVFTWPGMGRLMIQAVEQRDYPLLMGITAFFAVLVLFSNLIADIMYGIVDPRIRYD